MKKDINIVILIFITFMLCGSCGGTSMPMYLEQKPVLWLGDGGKVISIAILTPQVNGLAENQSYLPVFIQGEFISNFSSFSAMSILERQILDDQYAELYSGYYSDNVNSVNDLSRLTPTTHILGGNLTRTTNGYTLQMHITRTKDKMTMASYSKTFTFAEMDNLAGIRMASLELLEKIGVIPTERMREELTGGAAVNRVNAQKALAQGIIAQRLGADITALNYYYQASAFDPSLAEAVTRSLIVRENIFSSNIGENVRSSMQYDIQWRNEWVARLDETVQFVESFIRNIKLYTLFYGDEIKQGAINYRNETVTLTIQATLRLSNILLRSLERVLQTVLYELSSTGRRSDWGLSTSWPPFYHDAFRGVKRQEFSVTFELVNSNNEVIGRQVLRTSGYWNFDTESNPYGTWIKTDPLNISIGSQSIQNVDFQNVNVNKITDSLTIRVASINGIDTETAVRNGDIQIRALSQEEFNINAACIIEKGGVLKYVNLVQKEGIILVPNIVWDEVITSISTLAYGGLKSGDATITWEGYMINYEKTGVHIIVPDSVRYISKNAFGYDSIDSISIGANVVLGNESTNQKCTRFEDFRNIYNGNGRKEGTYSWDWNRRGTAVVWSFSPQR